ncbi:hypothetical protein H310_10548 [Aphanomyces invadans]|uniref:B-block binding subunit of TFIIIC domain-containing protein n=1 Tax=Aphanomyces invadans TaxID=157072 RepID=A0A024TQK6_9STRA|nr:hypothetical protein H310_10548 [Aphanomyces invadans]ETV96395.1 hypothetical protein H310_10548 [Aphanomyces invadans]|eukprot:XP_008875187.1 hypothetical protein H310_10548 [Aphanomyces invadans]
MFSANRAVAALVENVALEGRMGISATALFDAYLVGTPNDAPFRELCWRLLLRASVSTGTDKDAPIRLYVPSVPSGTNVATDISFNDAVASDVWVVACEALRFRALHLTSPLVMTDSSTAFLILEVVGKSRAKGISTMDITSCIRQNLLPRELESKKFDADLRSIHHYMDRLISQKLLVKKMVQTTENFKCKRFNIVLLPRFEASFDLESTLPQSVMEDGPQWKNHAVNYLIGYLRQQENHQCTFNDGMRAISIEKRRLEALKNYIIVESKKVGSSFPMEIFTANRADTKQRFWCVRLRDKFVAAMAAGEATGWAAADRLDTPPSMIFHEMGLVQQVYDAVLHAGPLGITSPDLKDKFGMYGKWPYRLLTLLATSYPVRMEKTVIGRNSVYRLIATTPPPTTKHRVHHVPAILPPTSTDKPANHVSRKRSLSPPTSTATVAKKKRLHTHTLRHSMAPASPTVPSVTDTTALRRLHILDRLKKEKIVSLYSLRSSIIEMENYAKDGRGFCSFNSGHRVDVRSIVRIVEGSPNEMTLRHYDMPIKSSLTASGTKSSRLVLAADATDADLKTFLDAYARDSRIQTLNSKAFVNPNVMIQPNNPPSSTSIAYKLKDVLTAKSQVERDRENQSHLLGKCHGFLYRCRLFHTYVFEYLQSAVDHPLLADVAAAHAPDRLFLLDPIFQSMSVTLYIRILGIGQLLLPDEFSQLQAAVKSGVKLADLPPTLHEKTTRHQSRRLTKLLRALIDLKVIKPHRLGHDTLMSILQGTDANGDLDLHRLVQYTLYDRVIGGFFIWHRDTRIYFSTTNDSHGWNTATSVRVNATKFPYTFGHAVPLVHSFRSTDDVDMYWEALECCATEQLTTNPAPGQVMKLPPLISTEHINMVAAKNWTPNTHGVRYSRRDKTAPMPRIPGSNKVLVQRRSKKNENRPDGVHGGPMRRKYKKYKFVPRGVRLDVNFTPEEDAEIMKLYLQQLQATWKVPVPVEMQVPNEPVAVRGPQVHRTQVSTVVITRSAAPHRPVSRVRRRIDELLAKLPNKLALLTLKRSFFGDTKFDEERLIESTPRLGALVTRVFMILFTTDAAYNQMAAEHLVGTWTREEIALVWRYFWLKGWIVVAKPFHIRGFVLTRRFHEIFKASCTMSYPLDMFVEAAEQASFLASRATDSVEEEDSIRCCGAVEHTALVLGHGHYQVRHIPLQDTAKGPKPQALKRRRDHRLSTSGCGLLNHLDQSELDQWHAAFIMSNNTTSTPEYEVFSHQVEQPRLKRMKAAALKKRLIPFASFERVLLTVEEGGMAIDDLVLALGHDRDIVIESVDVHVDEDKLVAVHGWASLVYVLPQFSQIWTVYPYTTTARGAIQLDTSMGTTPHPWLKLNTQANGPWLVRLQRKIVALLIQFPGCTEAAVLSGVEGVLPPQQVRLLLSGLVDEEVLYARLVRQDGAEPFDLFASATASPQIYVPSDDTALLHVDRSRFVVHYFPTPDCIVKYGQVAQEIDRV